jgi:hypothetical protein
MIVISVVLTWTLAVATALPEAQNMWDAAPQTGKLAKFEHLKHKTCFSGLLHELAVDGSCFKLLNDLAENPESAQTLRQSIAFGMTRCHYASVNRDCTPCLTDEFTTSCVRHLSDPEFAVYTEFLSGKELD